jgi:hypothetical protein
MAKETQEEKEYRETVVEPHPEWFSDPHAITSDPHHPVHKEQEQKATTKKES